MEKEKALVAEALFLFTSRPPGTTSLFLESWQQQTLVALHNTSSPNRLINALTSKITQHCSSILTLLLEPSYLFTDRIYHTLCRPNFLPISNPKKKLDFKQPYATNYKQKEIYAETEIKQNPQAHSQSIMPLKIP